MAIPLPAFPEPTYGSDADGLVWGYLLTPASSARPISATEAAGWLAAPVEGEFLWLHFNISNAAALPWLRQHLELPSAFLEEIDISGGTTRLEQQDDVLIAFLHDILFDFRFDATEVASVSIAANQRALVSARVKPLRSVDRLRSQVKGGGKFASTAELFAQLLREQADVLAEIIRGATPVVDQAEDGLLAGSR